MEFINTVNDPEPFQTMITNLEIDDDLKEKALSLYEQYERYKYTLDDNLSSDYFNLIDNILLDLNNNFSYDKYYLTGIISVWYKQEFSHFMDPKFWTNEKILSKLKLNYTLNMSDDQMVKNLKSKRYITSKMPHDYIDIIIKNKLIKSLAILLSFDDIIITLNHKYIFDFLISKYKYSDINQLIADTGLTKFYYNTTISSIAKVDLLIELNIIDYQRLYEFEDLEVFKYFMNQTNYDITIFNQKSQNIYFRTLNLELFKYIFKTYGHLIDINHRDINGQTCLFNIYNHEIVRYLIKHGADYNIIDNDGNVMFDYMYYDHYYLIVKLLLTLNPCRQLLLAFLHEDNLQQHGITISEILFKLDYITTSELNDYLDNIKTSGDKFDDIFKLLVKYIQNFNITEIDSSVMERYRNYFVKYFGI